MLKEIGTFSRCIQLVRLVDDSMPVQTCAVFLTVAANEGISINELADRCGLAGSSASRNVAALSDWHWLKKPGLGLVVIETDRMDLRKKTVRLTPKGKALIDQLVNVVNR
jgi:DNA-binding MarR family transcriptional regulator